MTQLSPPALYASPEIYDVAFGWDLALELDFLESCWAAHVEGPVRRILERVRHGPPRSARAPQLRRPRLRPEPRMVAFASRRLGAHGRRALRGDMADFRPPGTFDVAVIS
jgi:hypothetical protein